MSQKDENIKNQMLQAEMKIRAIQSNSLALQAKMENIQKQLEANQVKIQKIEFFRKKLQESQDKNNSTS